MTSPLYPPDLEFPLQEKEPEARALASELYPIPDILRRMVANRTGTLLGGEWRGPNANSPAHQALAGVRLAAKRQPVPDFSAEQEIALKAMRCQQPAAVPVTNFFNQASVEKIDRDVCRVLDKYAGKLGPEWLKCSKDEVPQQLGELYGTITDQLDAIGEIPPFDYVGLGKLYRMVACRKCATCRKRYGRSWAGRNVLEGQVTPHVEFVTLTLNDDGMAKLDPNDHVRNMSLFMKRLRKHGGAGIRFFWVREYGEKNGRLHYHAILYCDRPMGKWLVNKAWNQESFGFHDVKMLPASGPERLEKILYCAKYLSKTDQLARFNEKAIKSQSSGLGKQGAESWGEAQATLALQRIAQEVKTSEQFRDRLLEQNAPTHLTMVFKGKEFGLPLDDFTRQAHGRGYQKVAGVFPGRSRPGRLIADHRKAQHGRLLGIPPSPKEGDRKPSGKQSRSMAARNTPKRTRY